MNRRAIVAGRFYPASAAELQGGVQSFLALSDRHMTHCAGRDPMCVILPHAGHIFSGGVAGLTLGQVQVPELVVLIGPNHTGHGSLLALWPDGAWETPLGVTPVDTEFNHALMERKAGFSLDERAHLSEHSLEVILPFLQVKQPRLRIAALCAREHRLPSLKAAGLALAGAIREQREKGRKVCIIASTDMSHYIPHKEAVRRDALALEKIRALDPEGLNETVLGQHITMCGVAPVTLALFACLELGATECCVTAYTSSGITGASLGADMDQVVGYAGAIIV